MFITPIHNLVKPYLSKNPIPAKEHIKPIQSIIDQYYSDTLPTLTTVDVVLKLNYAKIVTSLSYRHQNWNYDYMAFSRRIGELWEDFIQLPFHYTKDITIIQPPKFKTIHTSLTNTLNSLTHSHPHKTEIDFLFNQTFNILNPNSINLKLDLHYSYPNQIYHIDFKSGFNSNEKGNTQRLIQVGSIYSCLSSITKQPHNCIALVRSPTNNNYLKQLANSKLWSVYTHHQTLHFIQTHTNFNIQQFITNNVNWSQDLPKDFYDYLNKNNLLKYLSWV